GSRLHGLDLGTKQCEGASFETLEDSVVDPLSTLPSRSESALDDASRPLQTVEGGVDHSDGEFEGSRRLGGEKRPMGPGVASHHVAQRVFDGLEEGVGDPLRRLNPESVAKTGDV